MRALVVYESVFGNTEELAGRVASGMSSLLDVTVVAVAAAPTAIAHDIDLVVVGGPTHAFGMSRPSTRRSAAALTPDRGVSSSVGLREWLAALHHSAPVHVGCAAAAFDTRTGRRWVPGSAARGAEARLLRCGFRVIATAETFWLTGVTGPARPGERERAERWGEQLARQLTRPHAEQSWSGRPGHPVL